MLKTVFYVIYQSTINIKRILGILKNQNCIKCLLSDLFFPSRCNEDAIKQVSNDVKIMWLQSALNFIKNDHQITLKFPTISVDESDFIEAILNQNCAPELDGRFTALYLSIKEALTIYKTKYNFVLNTVCKSKTTM